MKEGTAKVNLYSLEYLREITTSLPKNDTLDIRARFWSTETEFLPHVLHTDSKVIESIPRDDSVDVKIQTTLRSAIPLFETNITYHSNAGIKAVGIADSLISEQGLKRAFLGMNSEITDNVWLRLPKWIPSDSLDFSEMDIAARVWVEVEGVGHRDLFGVNPKRKNAVFTHNVTLRDEREVDFRKVQGSVFRVY